MIAAAQYTISDLNDAANEVIVGTQTAATASWTGNASFAELRDGQQIIYWLPYAGASNVTLNLTLSNGTQTGAIPVYYSGTTRLGTQYAAGNAIRLIYQVNAPIGTAVYTGWWADANYDSGNTYDRIRLNNAITAKSAITAAHLIVGDAAGYFHLAASTIFSINHPILYAASAIAAGKTATTNYLCYPSVNLRTTIGNTSWTATKNKSCYLVGTLNGESLTVASANWLTTEPADITGNLVFISLGIMYSTYQLYLYPEHPMFRMINGVLTAVSQIAYEAKVSIDSLEIGGRNYVLKSGAEVSASAALLARYGLSEVMETGETYTVSLSITPAANVTAVTVRVSDGEYQECSIPLSGASLQTVSATFSAAYLSGKAPENDPKYGDICVYRTPTTSTVTGVSTIHWIKLEHGTRATDYSAAPEDAEENLEVKLASVYAQISTESDSIRQEVQATYALASDMSQVKS